MANKKEGTGKKVFGGIALGLVLILLGGVAGGLLQHHYKWGEEPKVEEPGGEEKPGDNSSGGGEVSTEAGVSHGIKLAAVKLASSEYEDYGVSPLAETAYTLTATITPADAANKKVDWTIAFKNASSTWASGKTVTDYATVTPSADGALTAVVENVAAFGEQIIVKATSRDNAEAYATCTVEYLQRTTGYTLVLDGKTYNTAGTTTNTVTPTFTEERRPQATITVNKSTVYTRANTDSVAYTTVKPTDAFKTAITNAGFNASTLKTYDASGMNTGFSNWFDSVWGSAIYGSDNAKKNKLIEAISGYSGNAYEIRLYASQTDLTTAVATFNITLDASTILGQKGVESIVIDETEIVF